MTENVPGIPKYQAQYTVSPEFKKFWETLFHNYPLTDKELSQMTDQFIKQVWDQMNTVLQHYLQTMKELEQKRKEDDQGG